MVGYLLSSSGLIGPIPASYMWQVLVPFDPKMLALYIPRLLFSYRGTTGGLGRCFVIFSS
jgi:hypothetical protein